MEQDTVARFLSKEMELLTLNTQMEGRRVLWQRLPLREDREQMEEADERRPRK